MTKWQSWAKIKINRNLWKYCREKLPVAIHDYSNYHCFFNNFAFSFCSSSSSVLRQRLRDSPISIIDCAFWISLREILDCFSCFCSFLFPSWILSSATEITTFFILISASALESFSSNNLLFSFISSANLILSDSFSLSNLFASRSCCYFCLAVFTDKIKFLLIGNFMYPPNKIRLSFFKVQGYNGFITGTGTMNRK